MIEIDGQAPTIKNKNPRTGSTIEDCKESLQIKHNEIDYNMDKPMALVSQVGDTMHLHEAMKQPDWV